MGDEDACDGLEDGLVEILSFNRYPLSWKRLIRTPSKNVNLKKPGDMSGVLFDHCMEWLESVVLAQEQTKVEGWRQLGFDSPCPYKTTCTSGLLIFLSTHNSSCYEETQRSTHGEKCVKCGYCSYHLVISKVLVGVTYFLFFSPS